MSWLTHYLNRKHEEAMLRVLAEAKQFKVLIAQQRCTGCGQITLNLEHFTRTPSGWEAEVTCENCHFRGVVNSEGFNFQRINSKGKARE